MKKNLAKLIDLKSIITIIFTIVFNIEFAKGRIDAEQYVPIMIMILTFYFSKKETTKDDKGE